jgi:hypothetical protein
MHPKYTLADVVRLYSHLDLSDPEGCWLWTARRNPVNGYGQTNLQGQEVTAHRALWLVTYGPIPPRTDVCHRCDVRPCCRPDHLFLGTRAENAIDCVLKGRHTHAVVTAEQVRELRRRYVAGEGTVAALGREYGLASTQSKRIIRGESWRHLMPASEG